MKCPRVPSVLLCALIFAADAGAQANVNTKVDIEMSALGLPSSLGRTGSYPNGMSGFAVLTTACNVGNDVVEWESPMDPRHPVISFMIAREADGRFEQISDWSYVKHGFFAVNDNQCGICQTPPGPSGDLLGIDCADTYGTGTNGDRYFLGPPMEIDPWLGLWDPMCSHFDMGEPPVSAPNDCNGLRSLTSQQVNNFDGVHHRIEVADADLLVAGADYYIQGYYVVATEQEKVRTNNVGSRKCTPTWNGNRFNWTAGQALEYGSVLDNWTGATVTSGTNSKDDGRVYVGVKVSAPVAGQYHYEYAVHNRDAYRALRSFEIPLCPQSTASGFGFSDIDDDAGNDWNGRVEGGAVVFDTAMDPQRWNTVYNFWFDSDAGPDTVSFYMSAFEAGIGADFHSFDGIGPGVLHNVPLGGACGPNPPTLYAVGSPPRATIGNQSFGVESAGNVPGAKNVLLAGLGQFSSASLKCIPLGGPSMRSLSIKRADGAGIALHEMPIPNMVSLEGVDLVVQSLVPGQPLGNLNVRGYSLSNALLVRIGDSISGCN